MRRFTGSAAVVFVLTMAVTAFAGSKVPDLKGTWVQKMQGVIHEKLPEPQPNSHVVGVRKGHVEVDFTITIDKQQGFRFSGVKSSDRWSSAPRIAIDSLSETSHHG